MKKNNNFIGIFGKITKKFIRSKLTPVFILTSIVLGIYSIFSIPQEEEPQISVPIIDIHTDAPGFSSEEVEKKITETIEQLVWGQAGVEYIYSSSQPHKSLVTVRFRVGENLEASLIKIHHQIMQARDQFPENIKLPQIKSHSIEDVPFLVLTFSSQQLDHFQLRNTIAPLFKSLSSIPDLSKIHLLGGQKRNIRVIADPIKLKAHNISLTSVMQALKKNDSLIHAGKNWDTETVFDIEVGARLKSVEDIKKLAIKQHSNTVITLQQIAEVIDGPEELTRMSFLLQKRQVPTPAVSIVFSKRKGTHIVSLVNEILLHAETFLNKSSKEKSIDLNMNILRNYGATASEKSEEFLKYLLFLILSVCFLSAFFISVRSSLVIAITIPVTLGLTLAIDYMLGCTLNRVTIFALIFAIIIFVDDAVVVVENIERYLSTHQKSKPISSILQAVRQVGKPMFLGSLTIILATLPMGFIRGLMGPYMKPIPVSSSLAITISFFVSLIVTPWAIRCLLQSKKYEKNKSRKKFIDKIYTYIIFLLIKYKKPLKLFLITQILLLAGVFSAFNFKFFKFKMLPFDNKKEFQICIDFPSKTPIKRTKILSQELSERILKHPEVEAIQIFIGEPAPFSILGMIKHTFLRGEDYQADLHIVLSDKKNRSMMSHDIITQLRKEINPFAQEHSAIIEVLETPPGPPVLATLIAEIYGPEPTVRAQVTQEIAELFSQERNIVDIHHSLREGRPKKWYPYDYLIGGNLGTSAHRIAQLGKLIFSETQAGTLSSVTESEEIPIVLSFKNTARSSLQPFEDINLFYEPSKIVKAKDVLSPPIEKPTLTLYRKNLKPVSYVMGELSGSEASPVYTILRLSEKIPYTLQTAEAPWNIQKPIIKWDGEWFMTYEVFRDLSYGLALALICIYIIMLGWFKSFLVPLVILAPIPMSLIGILPGHTLSNSYFTATSMIGFIAGASIMIRNSIILIEFIEQNLRDNYSIEDAITHAAVLRFRPMLLTASGIMIGSAIMLNDPVFQGLSLSLIWGELTAIFLTHLVVPLLYSWNVGKIRQQALLPKD